MSINMKSVAKHLQISHRLSLHFSAFGSHSIYHYLGMMLALSSLLALHLGRQAFCYICLSDSLFGINLPSDEKNY